MATQTEEELEPTQEEFPEIEMNPVSSSNVAAVGFCPKRKCIRVQFNNDATYDYEGCNEKEFQDLQSAPSVGKFVHAVLKRKAFKKV